MKLYCIYFRLSSMTDRNLHIEGVLLHSGGNYRKLNLCLTHLLTDMLHALFIT